MGSESVFIGDRNETTKKELMKNSVEMRLKELVCLSLEVQQKFSKRHTIGAAALATSPKLEQKGQRCFEARDGGQGEGTRAMTREITLGTMNLVTFDVVSVPSKITSVMLATIKH